ncbi:uncharacterized protein RJT20DRAFT_125664 [Scheffersomyces xylosifermentans]|uniref:uncharacterized protein n=1 Tax=Scheffersomyces xylosifermentans TaxID=1304137 RepID=UPI00315DD323
MAKNTYKRQKLTQQKGTAPVVPPTKYEPSPASLRNFPSSIINGVTSEGGLFSLTFKSVTCTSLVENLDLLRRCVFPEKELLLSRITDKKRDSAAVIKKLKGDIETEKKESAKYTKKGNQEIIGKLQSELQDVLENGKDLNEFGKRLIEEYEQRHPNKSLRFSDDDFSRVFDAVPGVHVDKFEDVEDPDLTAYQKTKTPDVPQIQASNKDEDPVSATPQTQPDVEKPQPIQPQHTTPAVEQTPLQQSPAIVSQSTLPQPASIPPVQQEVAEYPPAPIVVQAQQPVQYSEVPEVTQNNPPHQSVPQFTPSQYSQSNQISQPIAQTQEVPPQVTPQVPQQFQQNPSTGFNQ